MNKSSRFALFFFGSIILVVIAYFWWIQVLPTYQAAQPNPPNYLTALDYARLAAVIQANATPKVDVKAGVVQVRIHNIQSTEAPLSALVTALAQFPQISKFRVTWGSYGGKYHVSKSAVLYDRAQKTLFYYCRGRAMCGHYSQHTAFLRVSEAVLVRDASDSPQAESRPCNGPTLCADDSPFNRLAGYDCIRHDLSGWFYPT